MDGAVEPRAFTLDVQRLFAPTFRACSRARASPDPVRNAAHERDSPHAVRQRVAHVGHARFDAAHPGVIRIVDKTLDVFPAFGKGRLIGGFLFRRPHLRLHLHEIIEGQGISVSKRRDWIRTLCVQISQHFIKRFRFGEVKFPQHLVKTRHEKSPLSG